MDKETTEILLANRSFLYALVARAFAEEPDEGFAEILASEHARAEACLVKSAQTGAITTLLDDMAQCLKRPDGVGEAAREYVRIFVGPGTLRANPWETVQLTGTRALFQPGVLDVRDAYRAAGFLPVRVREIPDDFIGVELDFLAKLAQKTLEEYEAGDSAWQTSLRQSADFLENHLMKWVGKLADSITAEYGNIFYASAARFAELVETRDRTVIKDIC